MKRFLFLGGAVLIVVGLGFVLPAIAQVKNEGSLPLAGSALLALGSALVLGGGVCVVRGVRMS